VTSGYPGNLVGPDELYADVRESVFQQDIINEARRLGFEAYSHNSVGTRCKCGAYVTGGRVVTSKGYPDLVLGKLGRLIYMELKSKKGKQSPEQKHWQAIIEDNGHEYYLFRPADKAEAFEILARS